MTTQDQDLEKIWQQIKKAGGRQAYIEQVLKDRGILVPVSYTHLTLPTTPYV